MSNAEIYGKTLRFKSVNNMNDSKKQVALVIASLCVVSGVFTTLIAQNLGGGASVPEKLSGIRTSAEASLPYWNSTVQGNITLTQGTTNRTFTLQQIYQYTQNGTIPVINATYPFYGHTTIAAEGIDPVMLMQVAGWGDCQTFTAVASDKSTAVFNTTQFMLDDPNILGSSSTNGSILVMAAWVGTNNTWLKNYKSKTYGNFLLEGDSSIFGSTNTLKLNNVVQIVYSSTILVNVFVNGVQKLSIGYANQTANVGNWTYYDWYYSGIGKLGNTRYSGITVASILDHAGISSDNCNISFIAMDKWDANLNFTTSQMVNGYTPGDSKDTSAQTGAWQGKQAMLATTANFTVLGYSNGGPFWLIIPGASKSKYIKSVIAIDITIISTPGNSTPGYPIETLVGAIALAAVVIYFSRKKKIETC